MFESPSLMRDAEPFLTVGCYRIEKKNLISNRTNIPILKGLMVVYQGKVGAKQNWTQPAKF